MRIYAHDEWVVGEPYKFNEQHNGLIVNTKETDNVLKVISSPQDYIYTDDILVYNKEKAVECVVNGKTYIAVDLDNIIARIDLEEGEENNG